MKNTFLVIILLLIAFFLLSLFSPQTPDLTIGEPQTYTNEQYTVTYPQIIGEGPLATNVRSDITEFINQAETEVATIDPAYITTPYEYLVEVTTMVSETTTSVRILKYQYTGGAHGGTFYTTYTVKNGEEEHLLTLKDFYPTEAEQTLFLETVQDVLTEMKDNGDHFFFDGAIEDLTFDSFQTFTIHDHMITLYFGQYEIAPYSEGIIEVTTPLE